MPLTEWELWACAQEAIRQHGDRATAHAAERVDALGAAGDVDGVSAWRAIASRIDQLQDFGKAHPRKPH